MPLWALGDVPLIVSSEEVKPDTRLSEHIVLDGTQSIIHRFGYGNGVRSLTAWILGDTGQYETLQSYYHQQNIVTLSGDLGTIGSYRIWSLQRKRVLDVRRTDPVYQLTLELKYTGTTS